MCLARVANPRTTESWLIQHDRRRILATSYHPKLVGGNLVHPVTHLLAGWAIANAADLDPRDSAIVAVAGAAPDLDGLGWVVEAATFNTDTPLVWYSEYHHVLGHNIGFCLLYCAVALLLGHRRLLVGVTAFLSFHLHLLFDLAGSRGADGYQWPIPYLKPFSDAWQLTWSGQWRLGAWQNDALAALLMFVMLYLAWRRGYSPLAVFSRGADQKFIDTLRARFGVP